MKELKKVIKYIFTFAIAICISFSSVVDVNAVNVDTLGESQTQIVDLRVNDEITPLGVDILPPAFSWKMESEIYGQKQTAYQIKVTKEDGTKVWDSKKVESDQSVGVKYASDKELEPATRYNWDVTIWDKDGKELKSESSWFETGLFGDNAWENSEWIMMGKPQIIDNVHYIVEADVTFNVNGIGVLFNMVDSKNFYMWKLEVLAGKVIFKPRRCKAGEFNKIDSNLENVVIPNMTAQQAQNNPIHLKLDVSSERIETFINGVSLNEIIFNDTIIDEIGICNFTSLGVRSVANEYGTVDNFKMIDFSDNTEGVILYDYDFETENPFAKGYIAGGRFIADRMDIAYIKSFDGLPTFRKEFNVNKEIAKAQYFVTALGVFDVYINGERVGTKMPDGKIAYDELKPGYTKFEKHVFYYSYDVKDMLMVGANTLTAVISSGWWTGWIGSGENKGRESMFRAKLIITYNDGSSEVIGTDNTWKTSLQGPISYGDIYFGEKYNANADITYRNNGYNDLSWFNAEVNETYKGKIVSQIGPSIRVREDLERVPQSITVYDKIVDAIPNKQYGKINIVATYEGNKEFVLKKGQTAIVDYGQNFAGWDEITVKGNKGTSILMRHAEMLNDNNGLISRKNDGPEGTIYTKSLRQTKQADTYVMNGSENGETYHPTHTYHGFRYTEITATDDIEIDGLRGMVVTSIREDIGKVETSDKEVNQLIHNVRWGEYSNCISIPTDCPQRTERQGWMGGVQLFSGTMAYNANVRNFLLKFTQDIRDSQHQDGAFTNTSPNTSFDESGEIALSDGGIIIPYNMYALYGDPMVIELNYDAMTRHMDYLAAKGNRGGGHKYGDWLSFETSNDQELSFSRSENKDVEDEVMDIMGIAYYAQNARMMSEMAKAIGKDADAIKYADLYNKEKELFIDNFVKEDGSLRRTQQICSIMALKMDLLPDEESKEIVLASLIDNIKRHGNRLQTGFYGAKDILPVLTSCGADEVAYDLLLQHDNPSWLYMVSQGGTTMWERWNSYTKEFGFGNSGMNSFNHFTFGSVVEWIYSDMAGIALDKTQLGFKHVILQPTFDPQNRINWVKSSYDCSYGKIISNWQSDLDKNIYETTIPANTTATVYFPIKNENSIKINGKDMSELLQEDFISYKGIEDGKAVFEIQSGSYTFESYN